MIWNLVQAKAYARFGSPLPPEVQECLDTEYAYMEYNDLFPVLEETAALWNLAVEEQVLLRVDAKLQALLSCYLLGLTQCDPLGTEEDPAAPCFTIPWPLRNAGFHLGVQCLPDFRHVFCVRTTTEQRSRMEAAVRPKAVTVTADPALDLLQELLTQAELTPRDLPIPAPGKLGLFDRVLSAGRDMGCLGCIAKLGNYSDWQLPDEPECREFKDLTARILRVHPQLVCGSERLLDILYSDLGSEQEQKDMRRKKLFLQELYAVEETILALQLGYLKYRNPVLFYRTLLRRCTYGTRDGKLPSKAATPLDVSRYAAWEQGWAYTHVDPISQDQLLQERWRHIWIHGDDHAWGMLVACDVTELGLTALVFDGHEEELHLRLQPLVPVEEREDSVIHSQTLRLPEDLPMLQQLFGVQAETVVQLPDGWLEETCKGLDRVELYELRGDFGTVMWQIPEAEAEKCSRICLRLNIGADFSALTQVGAWARNLVENDTADAEIHFCLSVDPALEEDQIAAWMLFC